MLHSLSSPALNLKPNEISTILDDPSSTSALSISSATPDNVAPAVLAAYKRGFRIVFLLSSTLAALAFIFALFLMPQIEIKHEKKADSNESPSNSQAIETAKGERETIP